MKPNPLIVKYKNNLFEELNYKNTKKSCAFLISKWCSKNIHPYNINTVFEDIDNFEEYEQLCNYTPSDNSSKMEELLYPDKMPRKVTVTDWHDALDQMFELDGKFKIEDFIRDLENLYFAIKTFHGIKAIEEDEDYTIAKAIAKEGKYTDGREHISMKLLAQKPINARCYHQLADMCDKLKMHLQYNEDEKKFVFVPIIDSVFDIVWYALICTISSNALSAKNPKINNRVIRCPNCGRLFVASSNRQIYCDSYECQAYRNCKKQKTFQDKKKKSKY